MTGLRVFDLTGTPADLTGLEWFETLRQSTGSGEAAQTVSRIISDVAANGDAAVVQYMRQWTDPQFNQTHIRVPADELARAVDQIDPKLRAALESAIANVRAYQRHIMPAPPSKITLDGAELGLRFSPVDRVGLAVPGGRAAYPSTVVMLAVPALVAGVSKQNICVVTPPPTRGDGQAKQTDPPRSPAGVSAPTGAAEASPLVLATCAMLGIEHVYRIGGAQAIAALALGTATVPPVDMIAGPGNVYTQLAKLQLSGQVGIDGFYGPSEIVVIADESANPTRVAADLIAQAEHDPGRCFLVAWSRPVIDRINQQLQQHLAARTRTEAITRSFAQWSAAVLVDDNTQAAAVADQIAAEHVSLAVADPVAWLDRLRHGGEFFLGDQTPVAAGDYWAGPSHCLPTGTTARFASGVSVYTFLKRSGTVRYTPAMPDAAIQGIAALARAEGLDGHAASVETRRSQ